MFLFLFCYEPVTVQLHAWEWVTALTFKGHAKIRNLSIYSVNCLWPPVASFGAFC